jgi:hypothetical protein
MMNDSNESKKYKLVKEPMNLREWRSVSASGELGRVFTCGRPGRATFGRERRQIAESVINSWIAGLPNVDNLQIVSLLGSKRNGFSEFDYYPFRSSKVVGIRSTWQDWLDAHYAGRFVVHEFPTIDAQGMSPDVLVAVRTCVLYLIKKGSPVVVVDSAGAERTARVCTSINYRPF